MKKLILVVVFSLATLTCTAQTTTEVAKELVRQGVPHSKIVLAQARLETGNFTSGRCKRDHNLFGIKHGKRYARYSHWRESVADYKARISSRYKGGDYYDFLLQINYASGKLYTTKLKEIVK